MTIPKWATSSIDPSQVSLTIVSIGKAGAGVIGFLGMLGIVDPVIAGQAWGPFVAQWATLIPALFATWHATVAVWGIVRKISVRAVALGPVIAALRVKAPDAVVAPVVSIPAQQ